jgi:cytoskeletal protein CcmA (bactofilin family)
MINVHTSAVTRGSLMAAGRIQLNSWFEGDIVCSRLDIGTDGYVLGNITTRELFVEGQIVGTVHAGAVHLMKGAFVEGDVYHHVLSLHATATLVGQALRKTKMPFPQELLSLESRAGEPAARFPVSVINEMPPPTRNKLASLAAAIEMPSADERSLA